MPRRQLPLGELMLLGVHALGGRIALFVLQDEFEEAGDGDWLVRDVLEGQVGSQEQVAGALHGAVEVRGGQDAHAVEGVRATLRLHRVAHTQPLVSGRLRGVRFLFAVLLRFLLRLPFGGRRQLPRRLARAPDIRFAAQQVQADDRADIELEDEQDSETGAQGHGAVVPAGRNSPGDRIRVGICCVGVTFRGWARPSLRTLRRSCSRCLRCYRTGRSRPGNPSQPSSVPIRGLPFGVSSSTSPSPRCRHYNDGPGLRGRGKHAPCGAGVECGAVAARQGGTGVAQNGSPIERHAERPTEKVSHWIERLARAGFRAGYVAYGVVYLLVGVLAMQAAFGGGAEAAGQQGALRSILVAPLGRVLLCIIALGLLSYTAWRLYQGVMGPEDAGGDLKGDLKGIARRLDYVINGLFHGALAFYAGQLAFGSGGGGGGSPDDWTASLMSQPFGRWLVVVAGLAIVGAGLYQFYKAYKADFQENLKTGEMSLREKRWTTHAGRLGYAARGVVFGVIGVFLIQAALQADPDEARGLGGALATLARQPFGPYLLGAVALGFVAYGVFMFVVARYRRIEPA